RRVAQGSLRSRTSHRGPVSLVRLEQAAELPFGGIVGKASGLLRRLDPNRFLGPVRLHLYDGGFPAAAVRLGQDPVGPSLQFQLSRHRTSVLNLLTKTWDT